MSPVGHKFTPTLTNMDPLHPYSLQMKFHQEFVFATGPSKGSIRLLLDKASTRGCAVRLQLGVITGQPSLSPIPIHHLLDWVWIHKLVPLNTWAGLG